MAKARRKSVTKPNSESSPLENVLSNPPQLTNALMSPPEFVWLGRDYDLPRYSEAAILAKHGQLDSPPTQPDNSEIMTDLKGNRLYINLSANQTRRRLKGYGFGVKKIYSDGKDRAVIIHTATGQHRDELHALFSDVIASNDKRS